VAWSATGACLTIRRSEHLNLDGNGQMRVTWPAGIVGLKACETPWFAGNKR
jgi:hypothetical protein